MKATEHAIYWCCSLFTALLIRHIECPTLRDGLHGWSLKRIFKKVGRVCNSYSYWRVGKEIISLLLYRTPHGVCITHIRVSHGLEAESRRQRGRRSGTYEWKTMGQTPIKLNVYLHLLEYPLHCGSWGAQYLGTTVGGSVEWYKKSSDQLTLQLSHEKIISCPMQTMRIKFLRNRLTFVPEPIDSLIFCRSVYV